MSDLATHLRQLRSATLSLRRYDEVGHRGYPALAVRSSADVVRLCFWALHHRMFVTTGDRNDHRHPMTDPSFRDDFAFHETWSAYFDTDRGNDAVWLPVQAFVLTRFDLIPVIEPTAAQAKLACATAEMFSAWTRVVAGD